MLNQSFEASDNPEQCHTLHPEIGTGKDGPFGLEKLGMRMWRSESTQAIQEPLPLLIFSTPTQSRPGDVFYLGSDPRLHK